jgi:hypothetical protein
MRKLLYINSLSVPLKIDPRAAWHARRRLPTPDLEVLFTVPVVESDRYVMALLSAALLLAAHNERGYRVGGGREHTGSNIPDDIS